MGLKRIIMEQFDEHEDISANKNADNSSKVDDILGAVHKGATDFTGGLAQSTNHLFKYFVLFCIFVILFVKYAC